MTTSQFNILSFFPVLMALLALSVGLIYFRRLPVYLQLFVGFLAFSFYMLFSAHFAAKLVRHNSFILQWFAIGSLIWFALIFQAVPVLKGLTYMYRLLIATAIVLSLWFAATLIFDIQAAKDHWVVLGYCLVMVAVSLRSLFALLDSEWDQGLGQSAFFWWLIGVMSYHAVVIFTAGIGAMFMRSTGNVITVMIISTVNVLFFYLISIYSFRLEAQKSRIQKQGAWK